MLREVYKFTITIEFHIVEWRKSIVQDSYVVVNGDYIPHERNLKLPCDTDVADYWRISSN